MRSSEKNFLKANTTLIKGGEVLNVFTGELEKKNVLIENEKIVGVGNYNSADQVIDASNNIVIPSFIDAHIHIESTMLTPPELAKVIVPHGTCALVTDPHEIANVCGIDGIKYMMQKSRNLPIDIYYTLPACVPATKLDESGANLLASDLYPLYKYKEVIGLSELMDFPSVVAREESIMKKIKDAKNCHKIVCGHAPGLSGQDLQKYISAGIVDDHECTTLTEAIEKLECGQTIIIREGSSAKNIEDLSGLFEDKYWHNCIFCTDDKTAGDIIVEGHMDYIIRKAIACDAKPENAIIMATIQAARHYNLQDLGAVSPGYFANINIVDNLKTLNIEKVLHKGSIVYSDKKMIPFEVPEVDEKLQKSVRNTFNMKDISLDDLHIDLQPGKKIRAIEVIPNQILTKEIFIDSVDSDDIAKIAVCERHKNTGHVGLAYLKGTGMKKGALASSVSHDSHNLIIIGTNDSDMVLAGNTVKKIGGGACIVVDGKIIFIEELPIAGLMSDKSPKETADSRKKFNETTKELGFNEGFNPLMTTGFCSLTVIPELRITTKGLVDVSKQEFVDMFV